MRAVRTPGHHAITRDEVLFDIPDQYEEKTRTTERMLKEFFGWNPDDHSASESSVVRASDGMLPAQTVEYMAWGICSLILGVVDSVRTGESQFASDVREVLRPFLEELEEKEDEVRLLLDRFEDIKTAWWSKAFRE